MKEVALGELIEIYNNPNTSKKEYPYFGINREKEFMPTVANTDGLDPEKYTVLEKGMFVFSGMQTGRDVCVRIGLYDKDEPVLISPAYTTFKIIDENKILPSYLFMNFNRLEMDRYGWFLSDSSIRSNLDWDRFCNIKIPLPSIETQRELVAVYSGLKELAEENERLLEPLSKSCEAFINRLRIDNGELKIALGELIEQCDERNSSGKLKIDDVRGVANSKVFIPTKADMDNVPLTSYKVVKPKEFCYVSVTSRNGGKISLAMQSENQNVLVSSTYTVFFVKDTNRLLPEFLFLIFSRPEFDRYARFNSWGSARETFDWEEMCRVQIPLPPIDVQQKIVDLYNCHQECKRIADTARTKIKTLCPALVQKASHSG